MYVPEYPKPEPNQQAPKLSSMCNQAGLQLLVISLLVRPGVAVQFVSLLS